MYMYLFLYLILSIPVALSYYYSFSKGQWWLASSLLFTLLASFSALSAGARVRTTTRRFLLAALPLFLILLFEILQFLSFYFQGTGFNDRFFFHFSINSLSEAWRAYYPLVLIVVVLFGLLGVSVYLCVRKRLFSSVSVGLSLCPLAILPFLHSPIRDLAHYTLTEAFCQSGPEISLERFKALGLDIKALSQRNIQAKPGRNLVLIYLESLERLYLDEDVFKDLTPFINGLIKNGFSFTNIRQVPGTGWTMAGMVASQCGTPLLYDNGLASGNNIMASGFLDRAVCLGDILKKAGYHQIYLGGASIKFAGKGYFLRAHGYDEVKGLDRLKGRLPDKGYRTGWGLYDDSLFEIAADEYDRLARLGRPFNLTLLTLDTHHPDGHASRSCAPYRYLDNTMLDAVHCTDQLLYRFIERISSNPAFKNTTVVLMSDHLAMRNVAWPLYPKDYQRRVFFSILNGDKGGTSDRPGTHMDIAPTVLDALGVVHNVHFLAGRDLFAASGSGKKGLPDFYSAQIIGALRYINSKLFSVTDHSLCQGGCLVRSIGNGMVQIGGITLPLYYYGMPLAAKRFQQDMAVIALVNREGNIEGASVIPACALPAFALLNRDRAFLLMGPSWLLSSMGIDAKGRGDLLVLFRRLDGAILLLGHFPSIDRIELHISNCGDLMASISDPRMIATSSARLEGLCNTSGDYAAIYDEKSGRIDVPVCMVNGMFYRVSFKKLADSFQFQLDDFSAVNAPKGRQDHGYCYAFYGDQVLNIPSVLVGKDIYKRLMMKVISDNPLILVPRKVDRHLFARR